ncbi:MAG: DUF1800 domain-containing protein [Acidobacteriaceae bacterium]
MALRCRGMREVGQAAWIGVLCGLMAVPQVAFAQSYSIPSAQMTQGYGAAKVSGPKRPKRRAAMTQQERVLHALNRFTFGTRPGDVERVEQMGLRRWFLQQLQPETIDDSAFEQRINTYPLLRLNQAELMQQFPPQPVLRMVERRDLPVPNDRVLGAIYDDAVYAFDERQEELKRQAEGGGRLSEPGVAVQPPGLKANRRAGTEERAAFAREEVWEVLALAPQQRVERLVRMRPGEMLAFKDALRPAQRRLLVEGMSPEDREIAEEFLLPPERVVRTEILESRLERDVFSERQLQAVMTEFWLNHFSVYLGKNEMEPYYLPEYERDVILPHALGRFENLLTAVAESPAMLMYLDNWESVGPDSAVAERQRVANSHRAPAKRQPPLGINENYARELMELHTLGVNGGYTQQDVIEVAKCFTGWTIERPYRGGGAIFDEARHEPGTKIVLGHRIKEGGQEEGLEVLHLLATSPATAHFLSEKLAVRFVSDNPPPKLVNRMAAAYLRSDGDIRTVLLTMFRSREFWRPQMYRAKVKTPVEFLASALRASGADVRNPLPLVQAMQTLGMPIYGMLTPQGYGWKAEDWVSSNGLIARMNFALALSSNRVPGVTIDWTALLDEGSGGAVSPSAETESRLEIALLGEPTTETTRSAVLTLADEPAPAQRGEDAWMARPAMQSGDRMVGGRLMQANGRVQGPAADAGLRLDTMAGLLLGSPEFERR